MTDVDAPSTHLDLDNWKLTLPVDANGTKSGTAREITDLTGYENPQYFFTDANGQVDFYAPVDGATTSGSHYPRSELRELDAGNRADWTVDDGGSMVATLQIKQAPVKDDGSTGRMVIGQIHGQDDELVRLYWDDGTVYAVSDHAGPQNDEVELPITDAAGDTPHVAMNENFSYRLEVADGRLDVDVQSDGKTFSSSTPISSTWNDDHLYFKAGVYLGVGRAGSGAGTTGHGAGEVGFQALQVAHGGTHLAFPPAGSTPLPSPPAGPPPLPSPPSTPIPTPVQPAPIEPISLSGTSGSNTLRGGDADDVLKGQAGDDTLLGGGGDDAIWGNAGNDTLVGGVGNDWLKGGDGKDVYVFDRGEGRDIIDEFRSNDTLMLTGSPFPSVYAAQHALTQTADGVVLDLGNNSSILFTNSSLPQITKAHWEFT